MSSFNGLVKKEMVPSIYQESKSILPPGSILPFAGALLDDNGIISYKDSFLLCNGALISRIGYPDLFECIGTTYNKVGDSTNFFRLPDFRGCFLQGYRSSTNPVHKLLWDFNSGPFYSAWTANIEDIPDIDSSTPVVLNEVVVNCHSYEKVFYFRTSYVTARRNELTSTEQTYDAYTDKYVSIAAGSELAIRFAGLDPLLKADIETAMGISAGNLTVDTLYSLTFLQAM